MDDEEKVVEVRTVKTEPPATTSGITLMAVTMILGLGLIIYAVKYSGDAPQPSPAVEQPAQVK